MADRKATGSKPKGRFRPLAQIGLRARITLTFASLGVVISAGLILASVLLTRGTLLDQREEQATSRARTNAITVTDKVGLPDTDAQSLFGSLSTSGRPSVILRDSATGEEHAISFDSRYGADVVPRALVTRVLDQRRAGLMRTEQRGEPILTVGVPLVDRNGGYFEVWSLAEISNSVRSLTRILLLAGIVTTVAGAALGWWTSRRVLQPLRDIADVAEDIAAGRLDARVAYSEWADDIDLAPLVSTFNEMVAALQARIDRDARFASDVSHELRSPLTTFNASLEVLRNVHDELPERAQTALDLLGSDVTRFTQLVEDLLEISRFDAGAVRLELDEVLIVDTVEIAVRTLSARPIPVEADPSLREIVVLCDKRRLVRILANFIDNAAKYGDGAIRITVDRVALADDAGDDGEGSHTGREADPDRPTERLRIGVEDNGTGVPEADREAIFDRFNRGSQSGSRGSDLGVGLGLALAAEHARLQGGAVWVEDRADGEPGARFVLDLPLLLSSDELDDDGIGGEHRLDQVPPDDGGHDPQAPADAPALDAHRLEDVVRTGEHRAIVVDNPVAEDLS